MSSCEFCEIFKDAFFKEHLHANTSDISQKRVKAQFAILITLGADSATNRRVRVSFNKICFSVTLEKQSKLIALSDIGKAVKINSVMINSETVTRRCSAKNVSLKISQNSQENTCARVSLLIKLQAEN